LEKLLESQNQGKSIYFPPNGLEKFQFNSQISQEPRTEKVNEKFKIEENKEIEEEEGGEESEYEFEVENSYEVCANTIKTQYTIRRKSDKKEFIERIAFCKTQNCPSKAMLKQFGNQKTLKLNYFTILNRIYQIVRKVKIFSTILKSKNIWG